MKNIKINLEMMFGWLYIVLNLKLTIMTQTKNKVLAMFNLNEVKKAIANCPADEVVILCGHWSINQPKYSIDEDPETIDWDLYEFENIIGHPVMVSDYDDLIVDVHSIYNY